MNISKLFCILIAVLAITGLITVGLVANEEGKQGVDKEKAYFKSPHVNLRSSYLNLNKDSVKSMLKKYNFYDSLENKTGDFANNYELKEIKGDEIVIDHATGLMWHQSGSENVTWEKAKQWVKDLNIKGYAGYNDWQLPTVDEAASLLESRSFVEAYKKYIDPIFDDELLVFWTGDSYDSEIAAAALFADVLVGNVGWGYIIDEQNVRPVRSVKGEDKEKAVFKKPHVNLRSSYLNLNKDSVKSMLKKYNFYDTFENETGDFANDYELREIKGDKVVVDHTTVLMWHQSGTGEWHQSGYEYITWEKAKQWVKDLNIKGYAGYNDWRLPTVEEAASLLESRSFLEADKKYIDPIFDERLLNFWTGDSFDSDTKPAALYVDILEGRVSWDYLTAIHDIRPVRSVK